MPKLLGLVRVVPKPLNCGWLKMLNASAWMDRPLPSLKPSGMNFWNDISQSL